MEQFKSFATSTLNGAINSTQTSITVTSATSFPTSPTFRIRVENEMMRVDSVSGNTFTVIRGADGSTAVAHSSGVHVDHVLTAGALAQYTVDTCSRDSFANLQSVAAGGRLLIPNDSPIWLQDDGLKLSGMGRIWQQKFPSLSSFTWRNQGSCTSDDSKGYILLWDTAINQWRHLWQALPTPPFWLKVRLITHLYIANYYKASIGFFESSTGKFEDIELIYVAGSGIEQNLWNSITSYSATRQRHYCYRDQDYGIEWLRIRHDGTNLYYGMSNDGYNFWEYSSAAKNNFFSSGPDQIFVGFNLDAASGQPSVAGGISLLHWEVGS